MQPLKINQFKELKKTGSVILDTRPSTIFCEGFVPESIFIGLDSNFTEWAGILLDPQQKIVLVTENGKEIETENLLSKIGLTNIQGYLEGGFNSWKNAGEEIDLIINIDPDELVMDIRFDEKIQIIDVRKETEFEKAHIQDALNLPLSELTDIATIANFEDTQNLYLHSAIGYSSVIASSLFKLHGFHNLRNINGGWNKIKDETAIKIKKAKKNKEKTEKEED